MNILHPTPDELSAFALGKLGDRDIDAAIAEHLECCAACRALAGVASDSFLELLRDRQSPTGDSGLKPASTETAGQPVGPRDSELAVVPAELRDHPRYRLVRFLGQGGMGTVYLAEHKVLKQPRTIKLIKPTLIGNPRAVERFAKEIELLAKLHHPHIVQAYDAEQAGTHHFLVMEYIEGQTLAAVLKERGPLPVALACDYIRQAALGLLYAHEQDLLHRDLKPANLFLTREGTIKILDFGLGRLASDASGSSPSLTDERVLMGTPEYMAPEQILNPHVVDTRADIYSLGCSLFCLLAGHPPFSGATGMEVALAQLQYPPPSLREIRPDVPAELSDLVQRMLAKKPEQRQQTAREVVQDLASFIHHAAQADVVSMTDTTSGWQEPSVTSTEQPSPKSDAALPLVLRRRRLWAVVALALLAVSGLTLWATVLRVWTTKGIIVLEQVPEGAEVFVDGERLTLKPRGWKEPVVIRVEPGRRRLEIKKDGFRVFSREVALDVGGRKPVTVRLELMPATGLTEDQPKGFIPLFNSKDLSGWKTSSGGAGGWEVENAAIVGRGKCGILYSQRGDFEDFHLRAEVLSGDNGCSGIVFRSPWTPHDPAAYVVGINATSRDLQRTGSIRDIVPVGELLHRPNEWFTLEVIAQGERIVTKVNGRVTVNSRDRSYKKGRIALWNNAGAVKFRRIDIKPLPPDRKPFVKLARDTFVPLFNGKDLTGWQTPSGGAGGWNVEAGVLVARGRVQNLYSEYGHFEDFHLRAEALINDGGLARIGFRTPWASHPAIPSAYYAVINATGPSPQRTGSLSDLAPTSERHRPDAWITLEVIARGDHITIKVNGKTTVDHNERRFRMGHILLEQRTAGSEIRFRKIEIKQLPPTK